MATNIQQITIGQTLKQTGVGVPTHLSTKGSEFTDISTGLLYINKDGLSGWYLIIDGTNSGGTSSLTGYTTTVLFDSHTGNTSNPHGTTLSNLTSSAHTHTLNEITDFNVYSGLTDNKINTKISTSDAQANYVNVSGDSMTGVLLFPATTTSQESLRIQSGGTFLSTTKIGAFEFVGNALYFTDSSDTRRNVLLGSSGSTATTLDSLSDTNVGGASDGDSFYYDATSGFWRNTNIISINDDTNTVIINNNLFGSSISGNTIYSGSTNLIDIFLGQTNFNTYSASTNTVITNNKNAFDGHSANTSNPHGTTLSNLTSSAHTHPISEINNLQTNLNSKFDKTGGTVNGNVVITGNVDILGTATTIHTSTLSIKDNIITLNSSQTGATAPTVIDSGIDILRNSATTASLLWEEDNDYWSAGLSGSTSKIILQGDGLSLLNSGHTHPISEIDNLQSTLDTKALDSSFDGHTGNTSNPHNTTLSNLVSSAHTHPISQVINLQSSLDDKLDTSIFNTYSGSVQTQLDTKIENGVNSGGANEVFSGKSGTDLQFRTISGGSNTIVTTVGNVVKIDSTGGGDNFYVTGGTFSSETLTLDRNDGGSVVVTGFTSGGGDNFYVTGFTYNDANTLKISQNGGLSDLTSTINTMTGLTVNGTLIVDTISATTINGSVTGLTLNDLDDVTTGIPTTPGNEYQGRQIYFDVASNEWISTQEYGSIGTVTIWGKKGTAGTIDKGCPVYITGFDDDIHQVELANATTATTMPVIGFTGEDFDNTTTNPIITFGKISGLDTTSTISTLNPNGETWAVNDVLYMNTTDGGLTKNRPSGTNTQIQRIAKVLKVGATSGQLFIFNTARTAGLPNLTTDYVWLGNGNDTPQEVIKTNLGVSVTGFSYDDNNTFTITDDNSGSYTSTINQVSGLTINGDLDVTGDVGIGTTPSSILDVEGSKGRLRLRLDDENGVSNAVNQLFLTSEEATYTNYISIGTTTLNAELQFGIIGPSSTSTRVGITDDAFILATSAADNMNFINNKGTGTSDNIGFYAGKAVTDDLSSVTPDIIILGDGANIGNVGIGTATPTEKLEVSGNTVISGTLNIGTIGGGTPIGNLGFDSNGQVVTGTTGGGGTGVSDANKIFSWFMTV